MIAQNNATHIVVGKDISLATTGARSALTVGQIGIFKNGSGAASATALQAGDGFVAATKDDDGNIKNTPFIKFNNIVSKSSRTYVAPAQKKVYVGYNGTTGSIAAKNSALYILRVILKDNTTAFFEHPLYELADFNSDASATQEEVALGLVKNMVKNFTNKKPHKVTVVQPGLINSATVVAANDLVNNATVVQGSPAVTVATAITYGATPDTIVVGDYLRIGGVGAGTALTSNVYKVTTINSLVLTLDRPVVEASGTYAAATSDIEVIPAATAAAANYGISLTGLALPFKVGMVKYEVLDFEVLVNDAFGATLVSTATNPSKGTGTYQEVAELEWFLKGNRGEVNRIAPDYPVDNVLVATPGKTYSIVTVNYKTDDTKYLDRQIAQTATIMFATEADSSGAAHANLKTVFGIS